MCGGEGGRARGGAAGGGRRYCDGRDDGGQDGGGQDGDGLDGGRQDGGGVSGGRDAADSPPFLLPLPSTGILWLSLDTDRLGVLAPYPTAPTPTVVARAHTARGVLSVRSGPPRAAKTPLPSRRLG